MQWEFACKNIGINFSLVLFHCKTPSYWNVNAFEVLFQFRSCDIKKVLFWIVLNCPTLPFSQKFMYKCFICHFYEFFAKMLIISEDTSLLTPLENIKVKVKKNFLSRQTICKSRDGESGNKTKAKSRILSECGEWKWEREK